MAFANISDFIKTLKKHQELIVCDTPVSTYLEITEITDRFSKQTSAKNKAILFTQTGTKFPVLINAFGSESRINIALGTDSLDDIRIRIESLFSHISSPKSGIWDALKMLPLLAEMQSWIPKIRSGKGACQECVMETPNLDALPILHCWPYDAGKFITLPMVITHHPETGTRNVGMYRMQVYDKNTTGMHWHLHKTGANHYNAYKKLKRVMPVSVAIGGDPAHTFSATAPLPENIDEFMLSGFLRKKKVELVKCITNDIYVPADADFIIEGYVDTQEDMFMEGPFGDHTGFYSLPDLYPFFHITCITHRKNAVYPTTIVGIPPMEDAWIGKASERIFLAPIKFLLAPEIIDYTMPFAGVAHNLVIVKIKKTFAGQAIKVMNTLWGAGQMMFNKVLLLVDEQCDITNNAEIITAILTHAAPENDVHILKGPLDVLDHAAPHVGYGSKLCIDATTKLSEEAKNKNPHQTYMCVAIAAEDYAKRQQIAQEYIAKNPQTRYIILHDAVIDASDTETIVWHTLNNCDPLRDCTIQDGYFIFDGTTKHADTTQRDWPTPVVSLDTTIAQVDTRWDEYKIGEFIHSPSPAYKKLQMQNSAWLYQQNK